MHPRFDASFWSERAGLSTPPAEKLLLLDDAQVTPPPPSDLKQSADESPRLVALDEGHVVFHPERYEPNYAYPLIVWFHAGGGNECDLQHVMRTLSTRNYLATALRGPNAIDDDEHRRDWPDAAVCAAALETDVCTAIEAVAETWNVRPDRIFLAGSGRGASAALSLLLARPDLFAGAVALSPQTRRQDVRLAHFRRLRSKRVLLGVGTRNGTSAGGDIVETGRLLHTAGMQIATRVYETGRELTPHVLSQANVWLMEGVCAAV